MIILTRYFHFFRNGITGQLLEFRIDDNVHDILAGIQHFAGEVTRNKDRCFGNTEIDLSRPGAMQVVEKGLVFFRSKCSIICFPDGWHHSRLFTYGS